MTYEEKTFTNLTNIRDGDFPQFSIMTVMMINDYADNDDEDDNDGDDDVDFSGLEERSEV